MATFEVQVEGITSIAITASSTNPSQEELTEFLKDGVIDVTNRWLSIKPQDKKSFIRESATTSSNGLDLNGADIISVIREAGADGDTDGSSAWRQCREIPIALQSRVVDTDSLSFASKYNPVYAIDVDGTINVYPVPDGTDDGFRVFYVNHEPVDGSGNALTFADSNIKYFPNDKIYLVVIYASMRTLQAKMGATTISDLSITAVPPDTPTLSSTSVTITGTAPTYTAPVFTSASTYLTEMEAGTIGAATSDIDLEHWFSIAGQIIEDEEDIDLAQVHLQKIATFLNAFQMDVQNQLNIFNDANVEYQAELQKNLKDADFDNQEDARLIQKYQAELAVYQAEVGSQVQEYTQNLQADGAGYQWLMGQYAALKADYNAAFMMVAPKQQASV